MNERLHRRTQHSSRIRVFRIAAFVVLSVLRFVGNAAADEAALESARQELLAIKQTSGAVSDHDYREIITRAEEILTSKDRQALWQFLAEQQNPLISRQDLADLIRTKRDSIADYRVKYRVEHTNSPNYCASEETDLAFAGNRHFLRVDYEMRAGSPVELENVLTAFDGEVTRTVHPDHEGKPAPHAAISPLDVETREQFAQLASNPLVLSMLVDSNAVSGKAMSVIDLVAFLEKDITIVFEGLVEVDGVECILAGTRSQKAWLDPARDFALVRLDNYSLKEHQSIPKVSQRFEELTDCGNGVWLPRRIHREFYDRETGATTYSAFISVTELSVNQGVPDELFTDLIPEGMLVGDAVRNLTYVEGDTRSIEEALGKAVPPPTSSSAWLWLVVGGNVAIVFAAAGFFFVRRRAKRTS